MLTKKVCEIFLTPLKFSGKNFHKILMNMYELKKKCKVKKKRWWVVTTCIIIEDVRATFLRFKFHSNRMHVWKSTRNAFHRESFKKQFIHSPFSIQPFTDVSLNISRYFWFSIITKEIPMHNGPFEIFCIHPLCNFFSQSWEQTMTSHSHIQLRLLLHVIYAAYALWPFRKEIK